MQSNRNLPDQNVSVFNMNYEYVDNDIQAILDARIKQLQAEKATIFNKPVCVLPAFSWDLTQADVITIQQFKDIITKNQQAKLGPRFVLLPCLINQSHWTALMFEFIGDAYLKRAEYIDSKMTLEVNPTLLIKAVSEMHPQQTLIVRDYLKKISYECSGPYAVESLLFAAREAKVPYLSMQKIRQIHVDCLQTYNPKYLQLLTQQQLAVISPQVQPMLHLEYAKVNTPGQAASKNFSLTILDWQTRLNEEKEDAVATLTAIKDKMDAVANMATNRPVASHDVIDMGGDANGQVEVRFDLPTLKSQMIFFNTSKWSEDKVEAIKAYAKTGVVAGSGAAAAVAVSTPWSVPFFALAIALFGSKYTSREFARSIQEAFAVYLDGMLKGDFTKYPVARAQIEAEFGLGSNGKSSFVRAMRWGETSNDQYGFAYYLLGVFKIQERNIEAYQDLKDGLYMANNKMLKGLLLIKLIELLERDERNIQLKDGSKISGHQRVDLLNQYAEVWSSVCAEMADMYLRWVRQTSQWVFDAILVSTSKMLPQEEKEFDLFLKHNNFYLLRHQHRDGWLKEIFFTFLQGIYYVNKSTTEKGKLGFSYSNNSLPKLLPPASMNEKLAAQKFETCLSLLDQVPTNQAIANKPSIQSMLGYIQRFVSRNMATRFIDKTSSPLLIKLSTDQLQDIGFTANEMVDIEKRVKGIDPDNDLSLYSLLNAIQHSKEVALLEFENGNTWLHLLLKLKVPEGLMGKMKHAVSSALRYGVNAYKRNALGNTAMMGIPLSETEYWQDVFYFQQPGNYFGHELEIELMTAYFEQVKVQPHSNLLALQLPVASFLEFLGRDITARVGFEYLSIHREDDLVNTINKVEATIDRMLAHDVNRRICIGIDDVMEWFTSKPGYTVSLSALKLAEEAFERVLKKIERSQVVLAITASDISALPQKIQAQAKIIKFSLLSWAKRYELVNILLQKVSLNKSLQELLPAIVDATVTWPCGEIVKFVNHIVLIIEMELNDEKIIKEKILNYFNEMRGKVMLLHSTFSRPLDLPMLELNKERLALLAKVEAGMGMTLKQMSVIFTNAAQQQVQSSLSGTVISLPVGSANVAEEAVKSVLSYDGAVKVSALNEIADKSAAMQAAINAAKQAEATKQLEIQATQQSRQRAMERQRAAEQTIHLSNQAVNQSIQEKHLREVAEAKVSALTKQKADDNAKILELSDTVKKLRDLIELLMVNYANIIPNTTIIDIAKHFKQLEDSLKEKSKEEIAKKLAMMEEFFLKLQAIITDPVMFVPISDGTDNDKPVVGVDGHTFNRSTLEKWEQARHGSSHLCPLSRKPMGDLNQLQTNRMVEEISGLIKKQNAQLGMPAITSQVSQTSGTLFTPSNQSQVTSQPVVQTSANRRNARRRALES